MIGKYKSKNFLFAFLHFVRRTYKITSQKILSFFINPSAIFPFLFSMKRGKFSHEQTQLCNLIMNYGTKLLSFSSFIFLYFASLFCFIFINWTQMVERNEKLHLIEYCRQLYFISCSKSVLVTESTRNTPLWREKKKGKMTTNAWMRFRLQLIFCWKSSFPFFLVKLHKNDCNCNAGSIRVLEWGFVLYR